MTTSEPPKLAVVTHVIRLAIACAPGTDVLADSIEELLAEIKDFTCSRLEYHAKSGLKPSPAGFSNPDVVLATLGSFGATNFEVFFSALQCAFPHRSVVVAMPPYRRIRHFPDA